MKKILITGTTGMVGYYIDYADWHLDVVKVTRSDFDIRYLDQVNSYFDSIDFEIEIIIHLAAETDVDKCEKDFDHAFMVNTVGTQNMVYQALKLDVPLLYTSTVGIFGGDGSLGPFNEFSPPCPANKYGLSKLYGEQIVRNHLSRYFIVRPGWMMGGVDKDKKFVMKIIKQIQSSKKEIFGIDEIIGSPTYAKELMYNISQLIKTQLWGTYHCTNGGKMSRYDMAKMICEHFDPSIKVTPVKSDYFDLPAHRALSEYSENRMLDIRNLNFMSSSETALKTYLDEIATALKQG
ncbi:MAG: SDR family oxidoreductase [Deltaproteobacteria bacterium]|nr:SDR family oxidoreductase [Deltaproteobacteria bacterium]MBW2018581.1 SDR family oxidoreductase [Deltaproteobacteria bacterium]MBW2074180.1 SDR family oxidoreductase [Deltaproteobacteria bacterium]